MTEQENKKKKVKVSDNTKTKEMKTIKTSVKKKTAGTVKKSTVAKKSSSKTAGKKTVKSTENTATATPAVSASGNEEVRKTAEPLIREVTETHEPVSTEPTVKDPVEEKTEKISETVEAAVTETVTEIPQPEEPVKEPSAEPEVTVPTEVSEPAKEPVTEETDKKESEPADQPEKKDEAENKEEELKPQETNKEISEKEKEDLKKAKKEAKKAAAARKKAEKEAAVLAKADAGEKKAKGGRNKTERLGFNWFFWISFIVLLVPVSYFAWLLYQASQETNTPVVGTRITDDVEVQITDTSLSNIKTQVLNLEGVEKCEVNLIVETLRVNVDTRDDMADADLVALNKTIYDIVDAEVPVAEYFTSRFSYKQYDLEITSYTNLDAEECGMAILTKNSRMEEFNNQLVSKPKNESVAKELNELAEQQKNEAEIAEQRENESHDVDWESVPSGGKRFKPKSDE